MSYRNLVLLASLVILLASHSTAQRRDKHRPIKRPAIIGVAHIGLKTDDLAAARNFYGHYLGYQEPFTLDKPSGGLMLTYFKVNDHQYIEIFPELKNETEDRLSHIAFETVNITQLRDYLASNGVKVPDKLKLGLDGNVSMMHHFALGVPSAAAGYKTLLDRGMKIDQGPKIGRDGKWQLNLYDPNLTRAELMEPKPVQTPCCSPMLDK